MNTSALLVSFHLKGETPDNIALDALPVKITITRTDAALMLYGGLAAWSGFTNHLGLTGRLADHCPVVRSSPNAAPVREVLHGFLLSALFEVNCAAVGRSRPVAAPFTPPTHWRPLGLAHLTQSSPVRLNRYCGF